MTYEQQFFLKIINDYIHGMRSENHDNINWYIVYKYAESHQLTAVVYSQCKGFLPEGIVDLAKKQYLNTICINVQRRKTSESIISQMRSQGIDAFLIKGSIVADFYPNWHFRTMGDTDIIVDNIPKAHDIMIKNGFRAISNSQDREHQFMKQNMEFEIHDRLVYDEAINLDKSTSFFNSYREYVVGDKLDDNFHFLFLINHLRKHFMNSGVGFRQFLDVAIMIKNDTDLDWNWIENQLQKTELLSFGKTVFFYIDRWFGVTAPIPYNTVFEDTFETSTEYVFANGVFGFENTENQDYRASNELRNSKYLILGRIKMIFKRVFPSYRVMCIPECYSFLRGKPFLLPCAWVYRIARKITKREVNDGRVLIKESLISKDYITKREKMFKEWGLAEKNQ